MPQIVEIQTAHAIQRLLQPLKAQGASITRDVTRVRARDCAGIAKAPAPLLKFNMAAVRPCAARPSNAHSIVDKIGMITPTDSPCLVSLPIKRPSASVVLCTSR